MKNPIMCKIGMALIFAGVMALQGCSVNEIDRNRGGARVIGFEFEENTNNEGKEEVFTSAADRSSDPEFDYDIKIKTSVRSIDFLSGLLVVDYDPKEVKIDANSFLFTRVDITSRYGSSETDLSPAQGEQMQKISLNDLSADDTVAIYANLVNGSELYAVAIELINGSSGPSSWAD